MKTLLGAYSGDFYPYNEQELHSLGQALGHPIDISNVFFNTDTWTNFDKSVPMFLAQFPSHEALVMSVPLTVTGTSLAEVASGADNGHFLAAAQQIAAYDPNAIIRIGWEANGDWFPWAGSHDPQGYIDAFRDVVSVFRSVDPHFAFDWTPNLGTQAIDPEKLYPGDGYVDIIGLDLNAHKDAVPNNPNPSGDDLFNYLKNVSNGLQWQADFATAHGKPMSFPEYAADTYDGKFITDMANWIKGHNVVYQEYWNSNENFPGYLPEHPADLQAYIEAWGGQSDYWHTT